MHPAMNNTKWEELRLAMYELGALHPQWRTKDIDSGFVSHWDGEWFYHFSLGGYESIEWVEIKLTSPEQEAAVLSALKEIHLPGHQTENGIKIYGYVDSGVPLEYI